jgi:hypothetical protein
MKQVEDLNFQFESFDFLVHNKPQAAHPHGYLSLKKKIAPFSGN